MQPEKTLASIQDDTVTISVAEYLGWDDDSEKPIIVSNRVTFWQKLKYLFVGYNYSKGWVWVKEQQVAEFEAELAKTFKKGDKAKGLYFYSDYHGNKVHIFPCSCVDFGHSLLTISEPFDDDETDDNYEFGITGNGHVGFFSRLKTIFSNKSVVTREIILTKQQIEKLLLVIRGRPTKTSTTA
jgi:hypothetical protein